MTFVAVPGLVSWLWDRITRAVCHGSPGNRAFNREVPFGMVTGEMAGAPQLQQTDDTHVLHRGKRLAYFGGCDYLRFSRHPRILGALQEGAVRYGLNVAASRVTTGNHPLYEKLEADLARFFRVEAALLVSSGYVTNLAVAQALAGDFTHVLVDERAHPSLVDAAGFFEGRILRFRHRDPESVRAIVRRIGRTSSPILLTDGVFSMDGSVAPLRQYLEELPRTGRVLVDDAHAAGLLGRTGRGTPEFEGTGGERVIQTITLSKAFGVYGGVILGSRDLGERVSNRSHLFIGNTPLPLPLVHAAIRSVQLDHDRDQRRRRLNRNTERLRSALRRGGIKAPDYPGPIVAYTPESPRDLRAFKRRLLAARIFPSLVRYPGGPAGGYFRFAISSQHSPEQLEALSEALMAHHRTRSR
jgi:7-keto-8-aminopelargonate synthetase-like enzyme